MKRFLDYGRSLLIVVFLLFCSAAWAEFTFVTDAAYPPFVLMNTDNTVGGFETDVIKAVCQEMQADCDFENYGWDTLIIGVVRGRFDAAYGGMEITEERQKQVAFSDPVYDNKIALLTRTAMDIDAITPAQLDDKTVGVQRGTTFQQYLLTNYRDEVNASPYTNIQEALLDLSRNQVDAVLADCPVLIEWLGRQTGSDGYHLLALDQSERSFFGQGYGIAIQKNREDGFLDDINTALKTIKSNGIYDEIYESYFSGWLNC